ncbi:MAG: efflux RND transporter permease subunit, partial [Pseudomonadota bacterium]
MNGLISWWARNGVAANLLMVLIIIVGIVMFFRLEREVFPSAVLDVVEIEVAWPGASPLEVENQIILRIEESISDIDNVKEIMATASEGGAHITVEMTDGANFSSFLNEIKSKVDGVSNLPDSSFPPIVSREPMQEGIAWISITSDTQSEVFINKLAKEYRDELSQIEGGSPLVKANGYRTEEVSVEVSETSLRRFGLTFDDVANAIKASSVELAAGEVRTSTGNIPIAARQLADTAEEFEAIVIQRNLDGSVVTVGDIANVKDDFPDANFIFRVDGKRGRVLQVDAPENTNVVRTAAALRKWVDEKQDSLPEDIELKLMFSMSEMYDARMELVSSNAITGLVLVLLILVLFLRPIVAFWVAAGIAISFVGTFIFLPMVGVSLNMLSLFALLLVIGIVVDDALIVGESIHRQHERGIGGVDAAIIGTQIVAKPVLFAVVTTMLAFSPFLFIGGGVSQFTKHIAWTVIFALTFSLIESFIILPSHLAHLKKAKPTGFSKFQSKFADKLLWVGEHIYRPLLTKALAARYMTVTVFFMLFFLSIALLGQGWIKFTFMPDVEQRFLQAEIEMQLGTAYSRT